MVTVCVLFGLVLLIGGIIIACATKNAGSNGISVAPPPLPSRTNTGALLLTATQTRPVINRPSTPSTLPPRRNLARNASDVSLNSMMAYCGPRGVRPEQFPCCPFDKQRNYSGQRQLIFWDKDANCYCCSRGHKFKSNGKPLFPDEINERRTR